MAFHHLLDDVRPADCHRHRFEVAVGFKDWFRKGKKSGRLAEGEEVRASSAPELKWIEADQNPWGMRVLDMRSVTTSLVSASREKQRAIDWEVVAHSDGSEFDVAEPFEARSVALELVVPSDTLYEGVLYAPTQMEDKWALFYSAKRIKLVRSWTRTVVFAASCEVSDGMCGIANGVGCIVDANEPTEFTQRAFEFLLRSHALNEVSPNPVLGDRIQSSPDTVALWCFNVFGRRAYYAADVWTKATLPAVTTRLRTNSRLHVAASRGNVDDIEVLLGRGIPVDCTAQDGMKPIHWALAAADQTRAAECLLSHGAWIDSPTDEGATPLMNAVQGRRTTRVAFCLDHGANPNAKDERGFTALHRAAEMNELESLRLLLDAGALESDAMGHTPRSLAEQRGNTDVIAMLKPIA